MRTFFACASALYLLALATPASAGCTRAGFNFSLGRSENKTIAESTNTGQCGHEYVTSVDFGFQSADLVLGPKHGDVIADGAFRLYYRASPGFRGRDTYAIRVCGKDRVGRGCSVLTYVVTVK